MVSGKTEMVGRKQLTFFKMINALVQRARSTVKTQNHFPSPNWPAQLPDLSIIENLWLAIKKNFKQGKKNSSVELFQEKQRIWITMSLQYVQSLYTSIPRTVDSES